MKLFNQNVKKMPNRTFKHRLDEKITAEKSYSYSKHYLILNETRTVLFQMPAAEIESSGSWLEVIEEKTEYTDRTFTLTSEQMEKFEKWRKKRNKKKGEVYVGAVGGAYEFVFIPTGIGTISLVRCADGGELNLTDENDLS